MKINEAEKLTGVTAKNIRFYEQQRLLSPNRNHANGYRNYDDGDIRTLKTIKLLRKLDMPLENIREVLTGTQPLAEVMQRHASYLAESIKDLEAAQRVCSELVEAAPEVTTLNVDECLERIDNMEQQGGRFATIVNDFLAVAGAVEKMRFHFFPDELVTSPQEFTDELLKYAAVQKLEITITKESMYPEFVLDGVEYSAFRYTSRFGSVIAVEAKEPDGLLPKGVPRQRRWWMEWMWRMGLPALVALAVAGLWIGKGAPLLVTGVCAVLAFIPVILYSRRRK